jgi:hypothetical protein
MESGISGPKRRDGGRAHLGLPGPPSRPCAASSAPAAPCCTATRPARTACPAPKAPSSPVRSGWSKPSPREEINPKNHSYLGNYPQALTHAALVQAALAIRDAHPD